MQCYYTCYRYSIYFFDSLVHYFAGVPYKKSVLIQKIIVKYWNLHCNCDVASTTSGLHQTEWWPEHVDYCWHDCMSTCLLPVGCPGERQQGIGSGVECTCSVAGVYKQWTLQVHSTLVWESKGWDYETAIFTCWCPLPAMAFKQCKYCRMLSGRGLQQSTPRPWHQELPERHCTHTL